MKKSLEDVFKECQFGVHTHEHLFKTVNSTFEAAVKAGNIDALCDKFIHLAKYPMVILKREPAVERTVKFIAKFVASSLASEEQEQKLDCPLFDKFFNFLLKCHEANSKAVRFRTCQMIAEIIHCLGDVDLDEDLCDQIYKAMLSRLSDKVPVVRVFAVQALCRLQDPTDKQCPIMKAFLFLMSKDPNQDVRMACLRNLAPVKRTLSAILERTRDVSDSVRKVAYLILSEKVSVKALSIAQRITLLEDGLSDRSTAVQSVCTDKLLQAWLVHYSANVLDLLNGLDVMSSGDLCEKAVHKILSKVSMDELLQGCDIINENRVINEDNLNCESVFYWRLLCKHIHSHGDGWEEMLEKILPDAKDFIEFIQKNVDLLDNTEFANSSHFTDDMEARATREFIIQQLLMMMQYLDISDPVSRKSVLSLCRSLLQADETSVTLTPILLTSLSRVLTVSSECIREVSEIIGEIQMPSSSDYEEEQVTPEDSHKLKLKLASINMELNELTEQLEAAVIEEKYTIAAEIKDAIKSIELCKKEVIEQMQPKKVPVIAQARTDDTVKQKCLSVFTEMMKNVNINKINDTVRSFMDEMVVPAIPDPAPAVRNQAVKAFGHCCLLDVECARKNIVIFVQIAQLDEEAIRVSALEVIFDIIQTFGIECFQTKEPDSHTETHSTSTSETEQERDYSSGYEADEEQETGSESSANRNANNLIHIIVGFLDDESSDVRSVAAEGLAKLLLSGRVVSAKLLTRLILLWYNPITEDDYRLRHCLGVFLPVYSFCNSANQQKLEEAFLPTLNVIFDAPNTSPLSDIDESNVADLMVQLTNHKQLITKQPETNGLLAHDSLALKICREVIRTPNTYGTPTLIKALTMLDVNGKNDELNKDLTNFASEMVGAVKDKKCLKLIHKFQGKLATALSSSSLNVAADTDSVQTNGTAHTSESGEVIDSTVLDVTTAGLKKRTRKIRKDTTILDSKEDSDGSSDSIEMNVTKLPRLKNLSESD